MADVSQGLTEKQNLLSGIEKLLEQQSQFLGVFIFLGILVAAAVLFNTLVMNLAERDLELSTLRVLGGSTTRLGSMIIGRIRGIIHWQHGLASLHWSWQRSTWLEALLLLTGC